MKTMLFATAAIAAAAFGATTASAQSLSQPQVYGSMGATATDNKNSDSSLNSINGRVGAKLTPHFGVEGELAAGTNGDSTNSGRYKLTNKKAAYAVGFVPVSDKVDLIGRVGVSDTKLKKYNNQAIAEDGTALDVGVGAQVHLNDSYAIRGDYTRSSFKDDKGDADNVTVSVVKKF
ncbi:porin family protein [Asticcacaulis sp. BYS171W]|uniref:Porin family protein n=1 Tax=Asticcacaulis aquaticus TaxID=2984212 RepID=A0ABT5HVJ5_9CAUL|nr:porin family protein [Asticcacaulis aquaticus]MDC7683870.1 porin family protein [Asticcacaulis aquaticus]